MPSSAPTIHSDLEKTLQTLGQQLHDHRKRLKISAAVTAEAAGISRTTLSRIEKGEPSVTMGAYLNVIVALGLKLTLKDSSKPQGTNTFKLPNKIQLATYPQLKQLAWQLKDSTEVTPQEALDLYERNWRHLDTQKLEASEQALIQALLTHFGRERLLV